MRIAPAITLPADQQAALQQWARSRSLPARVVERARIVLLAAEGRQDKQIAAAMKITSKKASRWRSRFLTLGMAGGPVPQHNSPGTLLFDAVYLSAHDMLAKEIGRKAMILLTDGQDEGSKLKLKDAIEAAQKADAIVYVLLCADRGGYFSTGMSYYGEADMDKLTRETGGRVINVGNKFDKLREAFDQIASELRSQYNIGYTPPTANSTAPIASWRSRTRRTTKSRPAPDTTPARAGTDPDSGVFRLSREKPARDWKCRARGTSTRQ